MSVICLVTVLSADYLVKEFFRAQVSNYVVKLCRQDGLHMSSRRQDFNSNYLYMCYKALWIMLEYGHLRQLK